MTANLNAPINPTSDPIARRLLENLPIVCQRLSGADSVTGLSQIIVDSLSWNIEANIAPCPLDKIFVATLDSPGGQLMLQAARNTTSELNAARTQSFSIHLLAVFADGIAVNFTKDSHPELSESLRVGSGIAVPFMHNGVLHGGFVYGNQMLLTYPPEALFAANIIASQVAATLAHLKEMGQIKTQLNTLQTDRDLFESILESTTDAILMVDHRTRTVLTANMQFETFFRLPRYQIVKQDIDAVATIINARGDLPRELANLLMTFSNNEHDSAAGDFDITDPQRRTLVWYSSPVHAPDFQLMGRLFAFRDATAEREVERSKNEFVSLVSHELRTPLTAILGFTELMLEGDISELSDPMREYVRIIHLNAERLIAAINDILDLTKLEAGRLDIQQDYYQITSIINAVHLLIQPKLMAHDQSVTISIEPNLPPVWVDKERLIQVLANLLSNASKYSNDGTTIYVEARLVTPNDLPLPGRNKPASQNELVIGVYDTGMGIPLEEQGKLFSRFYRTEQVTRNQIAGAGLGLVIVKSFVELHHGEVWVYSEEGKGSSFYFTLPVIENPT